MHDSVMEWVAAQVERFRLADADVLEVGSYDVNGTVRPLFTGRYLGVDLQPGPGVDLLVTDDLYDSPRFDVIVSTEMLEHDARPWVTLQDWHRALRPGGCVLITARGFEYGPHDYPADYWRFSEPSMRLLLKDAGFAHIETAPDPQASGVFASAWK